MDQLAVELLTEIFTMACTDGGQATARSLSLVCKQYNAVALPLRFHSIRLGVDATRIMPLLAALELEHATHDTAHAPKVRHIRLVDMARLWQKGVRGRNSLYHAEIAKPWFALLSSILRLAAPHLETLAVCGCYLAQLMPAVEFPALRELYCVAGPKHFSSVAKGIEPGVRLYPALERLHHVLGDFNSDVEGWAHHAPNVTHLYVSQISTKADAYKLAKVNGKAFGSGSNTMIIRLLLIAVFIQAHLLGLPGTQKDRAAQGTWNNSMVGLQLMPVYRVMLSLSKQPNRNTPLSDGCRVLYKAALPEIEATSYEGSRSQGNLTRDKSYNMAFKLVDA